MVRLLQLLALIALVWVVWRLLRQALLRSSIAKPDAPPQFEPTGKCARCGTHVPRTQLDAAQRCPRCAANA